MLRESLFLFEPCYPLVMIISACTWGGGGWSNTPCIMLNRGPGSGPSHMLFPLPGMLFPAFIEWLDLSHFLGLGLNSSLASLLKEERKPPPHLVYIL